MISRLRQSSIRRGFTLVELLVSIAVISILIALLLPAVQMARESARRVQCRNNMRQLALGIINAEETFGHYPSNGWGWQWVGDPDRGYGVRQPGGWLYQILPYIEQSGLRQLGSGQSEPIKRLELARLTATSIPVLHCPTRPAPTTCPIGPEISWRNSELGTRMARTDYVGNAGDQFSNIYSGPISLAEGDSASFPWPAQELGRGIFHLRRTYKPRDITDGLSMTYLVAEKYVDSRAYDSFTDNGYDQSFAAGDDWDLVRWTEQPPLQDGPGDLPQRYGSAHPGGLQVAICDGSVRTISYQIDAHVHRILGSRNDGEVVPDY